MFTEEEAKTKWCPFSRAGWTGGVESQYSGNRWFEQDGETVSKDVSCLGPRCAAWTWQDVKRDDGWWEETGPQTLRKLNSPPRGRCGLSQRY